MRRILPRLAACTLVVNGAAVAAVPARAEAPTVVSFERVRPGALPPGFRTLSSADEEPGRWEVVRVDGTAALSQTDAGRAGYRLAVLESPRLEHLRAAVRLRMGRGDRAAGLAWRVRDVGNYYAARLDLRTDEFIVYKFVHGNRVRLSRLTNLRLDAGQWHDIAVEHVGNRIRVWLNGIPVAAERDATLSGPGMIGVWMPGDSTAHAARISFEAVEKD